jgi:hypothetical protein
MRMLTQAHKAPIVQLACLTALALLIVAATLLIVAALPASAHARVVISGGEARLTLDRGLARQLHQESVDIAGIRPGTAQRRAVELPVVAGATNGAPGRGALTVDGGFSFDAGKRVARIEDLLLNTGKGQSTARIAGAHRILAKHGPLKSSPAGFGTRIRIPDLTLTGGTAAALNRKLALSGVFRRGQRLGSLAIVAIPKTVQIAFGRIALGGPDTTFSRLQSLDVQMGIWGASEKWSAPAETYFLFDVAPTALTPDASAGVLEASANDGVTMEIHAPPPRNMLLRGPRINLAARELSATISPLSTEGPVTATIATLDYSAATFQVRPKVGVFELMGIRAIANQLIADLLNERFATPGLFQAGETFARVTATLHAQ